MTNLSGINYPLIRKRLQWCLVAICKDWKRLYKVFGKFLSILLSRRMMLSVWNTWCNKWMKKLLPSNGIIMLLLATCIKCWKKIVTDDSPSGGGGVSWHHNGTCCIIIVMSYLNVVTQFSNTGTLLWQCSWHACCSYVSTVCEDGLYQVQL